VVITGFSISRRFRNLESAFILRPLSVLLILILPYPLLRPLPLPLTPLNGILISLGSIIEFRNNS
jgi:hypothetical protein